MKSMMKITMIHDDLNHDNFIDYDDEDLNDDDNDNEDDDDDQQRAIRVQGLLRELSSR